MPIRERNGRFQVVVEHLPGPGGRRRQRTVGTFGSRDEAADAERRAQGAYRAGGACDLPLRVLYWDWWVPRLEAEPLAASTIRHYKARIEQHVLPILGSVPAARVTGRDLNRLETRLRLHEGKSDGQIRAIRMALRRFLRDVREAGYIDDNIVAKSYTRSEVHRLRQQRLRTGP